MDRVWSLDRVGSRRQRLFEVLDFRDQPLTRALLIVPHGVV